MSLKRVASRVSSDRLLAVDSIAETQERNPGVLLNEAVEVDLSLQDYHRGLIEQGLRDDEAGDVIEHSVVCAMFANLKRPQV